MRIPLVPHSLTPSNWNTPAQRDVPACHIKHDTGRPYAAVSLPPTHLIDSVIILRASLMFSSVCCTHVCGMRVPMVVVLDLKDKGSKAL